MKQKLYKIAFIYRNKIINYHFYCKKNRCPIMPQTIFLIERSLKCAIIYIFFLQNSIIQKQFCYRLCVVRGVRNDKICVHNFVFKSLSQMLVLFPCTKDLTFLVWLHLELIKKNTFTWTILNTIIDNGFKKQHLENILITVSIGTYRYVEFHGEFLAISLL